MDAAQAWRIIRRARQATFEGIWHATPELDIRAGGAWSARAPVAPEVATLLDTLLPVACSPLPYAIAQLGQSLDGRIATATGESHYITGITSRVHLHRLRALVDAVIVGVGTVAADDPELTVRHVEGESPVRVVLDPHARVPPARRLFRGEGPLVWHAIGHGCAAAPNARALELEAAAPPAIARELLARLAAAGFRRVLIEGGATTVSTFLAAGCVNRMHLVVAPILLGAGCPSFRVAGRDRLADALRPRCASYAMGEDRLYDLDFGPRGLRPMADTAAEPALAQP